MAFHSFQSLPYASTPPSSFRFLLIACQGVGTIAISTVQSRGSTESQFEDMHSFSIAGDTEQRAHQVEGHGVDLGRIGATTELVDFVGIWDRKDTNHRSLQQYYKIR